ncbi:MAG TPA: hypothetical protein PLU35_10075 [Phycisphaerales bacterium]|nr:hypothetical protein [Phycisphaerales bacterium]
MTADATTLTLGHSPDGDDMAMWWPLTGMRDPSGSPVNGESGRPRVDTAPFAFETLADDVHELNKRAFRLGDLDATAISAATYPFISDRYVVTACGGSFGEGYGPRVVVRADSLITNENGLRDESPLLAVPGADTTAFMALSLLLGHRPRFVEARFDLIPEMIARGEADAGLLIHEAQLTFESAGLREVANLGAWWARERGIPLPLGLNVVRRDLDLRFGSGAVERIAGLLSESVRFARAHPDECRRLLLLHAENRPEWRDDALVDRYLSMYVSPMSEDMGDAGREALRVLLTDAAAAGLCPEIGEVEVVG